MFSKEQAKILELLARERRWWYGLELVAASDGVLWRGTVYVDLNRLIDQGVVEDRCLEGDRRQFRITEGGMRAKLESEVDQYGLVPEMA